MHYTQNILDLSPPARELEKYSKIPPNEAVSHTHRLVPSNFHSSPQHFPFSRSLTLCSEIKLGNLPIRLCRHLGLQ